jgi:hypothetical protein
MKTYTSLFWTGAFFPLFILVSIVVILTTSSQEPQSQEILPKEIAITDTVYVVKIVTDTVYIHTQQFCKKKHCEETQEIQDTIN